MSAPTFLEAFCEQNGISKEQFSKVIFWRALYPHARIFALPLRLLRPGYFAADMDLINATARLRRLRDFTSEVTEFNYNPSNRGWFRRRMRVRVSTQRLKLVLRDTLREGSSTDAGETAVPFATPAARRSTSRQGSH